MAESAWVARLGWTLLHSLWQGLAVALVLALVLRLLHRRSAQARYLASCAALAALPLAMLLTALSVQPPARDELRMTQSAIEIVDALALLPMQPAGEVIPIPATPAEVLRSPAQMPRVSLSKHWRLELVSRIEPALPWLVGLWLAGALLLAGFNLGAWGVARRLRRRWVEPADDALHAMLERLRERLGVTRPVTLLVSRRVDAPAMLGWLKPAILLPVGVLTGLTPAQVEAILAHELAHIRRHDYLVNLAQTAIESLLFYHPATWWISRRIRVEREFCCDDMVLRSSTGARDYALALVALEAARMAPAGPMMAATGGKLMNRIQRLLGVTTKEKGFGGVGIAGVIAMLLLLAIVLTTATVVTAPPLPAQATVDKIERSEPGDIQTTAPGGIATTESSDELDADARTRHFEEERRRFKEVVGGETIEETIHNLVYDWSNFIPWRLYSDFDVSAEKMIEDLARNERYSKIIRILDADTNADSIVETSILETINMYLEDNARYVYGGTRPGGTGWGGMASLAGLLLRVDGDNRKQVELLLECIAAHQEYLGRSTNRPRVRGHFSGSFEGRIILHVLDNKLMKMADTSSVKTLEQYLKLKEHEPIGMRNMRDIFNLQKQLFSEIQSQAEREKMQQEGTTGKPSHVGQSAFDTNPMPGEKQLIVAAEDDLLTYVLTQHEKAANEFDTYKAHYKWSQHLSLPKGPRITTGETEVRRQGKLLWASQALVSKARETDMGEAAASRVLINGEYAAYWPSSHNQNKYVYQYDHEPGKEIQSGAKARIDAFFYMRIMNYGYSIDGYSLREFMDSEGFRCRIERSTEVGDGGEVFVLAKEHVATGIVTDEVRINPMKDFAITEVKSFMKDKRVWRKVKIILEEIDNVWFPSSIEDISFGFPNTLVKPDVQTITLQNAAVGDKAKTGSFALESLGFDKGNTLVVRTKVDGSKELMAYEGDVLIPKLVRDETP